MKTSDRPMFIMAGKTIAVFVVFMDETGEVRTISGNPRQFNCRDESVLLVFSGACNKENISQESNKCLHFAGFVLYYVHERNSCALQNVRM